MNTKQTNYLRKPVSSTKKKQSVTVDNGRRPVDIGNAKKSQNGCTGICTTSWKPSVVTG